MHIAGRSHRAALMTLFLAISAPLPWALAVPPWGTTTDWKIGRIWTLPPDPPLGVPVLFLAEVLASRSDGAFPQEVSIAAYLDGYPIGLGRVLVPALNTPVIFCAGGGWNATPGTHRVRFIADPRSVSNDPDRANNIGEASFEVGARATPPGFDFSLNADPNRRSVMPGGKSSYEISVEPRGNSTAAVALALFGLPEGTSYYFDPPFGELPLKSRLTIYVPERGLGGAPIQMREYYLTILAMAGGTLRRAIVALDIGPSTETTTAATTTIPSTTIATTTAPPRIPSPTIRISFYRAVLLMFAIAFIALAAYHMLKERRAKASATGASRGSENPP
ncbi:MAG: hypothetical protein QXJ15_05310 [Candidatus Bathyarchaeia archaeon]